MLYCFSVFSTKKYSKHYGLQFDLVVNGKPAKTLQSGNSTVHSRWRNSIFTRRAKDFGQISILLRMIRSKFTKKRLVEQEIPILSRITCPSPDNFPFYRISILSGWTVLDAGTALFQTPLRKDEKEIPNSCGRGDLTRCWWNSRACSALGGVSFKMVLF